MRRICIVAVVLLAAWCLPVYANKQPEQILKAILKLRSVVPGDARTASTLGTEREGSAVVIDSNGLMVTIGYLILEAEQIEVAAEDGKAVRATFVAYDDNSGIGLLRVTEPLTVEPIRLGESSQLNLGDPLLVAAHGGADSVQGVRVVSRQEFAGYWEYLLEDPIYTVPPYSSFGGAALIDSGGRLVGIGSLYHVIDLPTVGSVASNMFVPIDHLRAILSDLISKGRSSDLPKPWLGLYAEETHGRVFVIRVSSEGPAEQAGLQARDIILTVGAQEVKELADFYRKVWALGQAGIDVSISILRGIQVRDLVVHSGDRYQYFKIHTRN